MCIQNCLVNWEYNNISMASNDKLKCMCTFAMCIPASLFSVANFDHFLHHYTPAGLYQNIHNSRKTEKKKPTLSSATKDAFFNFDVRWKKQANLIHKPSKGTHEKQKEKIKDEISVAAADLSNYQHTAVTRTGPNRQKQCTPWQLWNETPHFNVFEDPRYIIIHVLLP